MKEYYDWFSSILKIPLGAFPSNEKGLPVYSEKIAKEASLFLTGDDCFSSTERLGIYHRQIWRRLYEQIQAEYPALSNVIGSKIFTSEIAEAFLAEYWPPHKSLANLGLNLPLWLSHAYQGKNRDLVLGIAQIDWAFQRLHFQKQVLLYLNEQLFALRDRLLQRTELAGELLERNILQKKSWYLFQRSGWKKIDWMHAWFLKRRIKITGGYFFKEAQRSAAARRSSDN